MNRGAFVAGVLGALAASGCGLWRQTACTIVDVAKDVCVVIQTPDGEQVRVPSTALAAYAAAVRSGEATVVGRERCPE
jgi:hypothetical protein